MDRQQQDFLTFLVAAMVIVANVATFVLWREVSSPLLGGAFGLLGLPSIRNVNESVKRIHANGEAKQ